MKRFKKILIDLPKTVADESVLNWASVIVKSAAASQVDIVSTFEGYQHILDDAEWQEFVDKTTHDWHASSPLKELDVEVNYSVHRRPNLQVLLEQMASGDYDLVILPKEHCEGATFVERVVRKSTTGVLVVPMHSAPDLSSIMLAVDFADISELSLEWAEAFASLAEAPPKLKAIHVMDMPDQAHALGVNSPSALHHRIYDISKGQLENFIKDNAKEPESWKQEIAEHHFPSSYLLEASEKENAKLLVIGSHGRNAISSALLGGQSIEIIRGATIPLLVVKKKNETLGFVRTLLGMK